MSVPGAVYVLNCQLNKALEGTSPLGLLASPDNLIAIRLDSGNEGSELSLLLIAGVNFALACQSISFQEHQVQVISMPSNRLYRLVAMAKHHCSQVLCTTIGMMCL